MGWAAPVGLAVVSLSVIGAVAGCGGQPSADDLWSWPARSAVQDAHATLTGSGGGVSFQGEGVVVFKPRPSLSLRLQTTADGMPGELDVLEVGGMTYERTTSDQKWVRSAAPALDPTGDGATDPVLVGQGLVGGSRAWHLRASRGGSPVEMWVRQSDGYPLRVVTHNSAKTVFTVVYDRFNASGRVTAPLALDLAPAPRKLTGQVGDVLQLTAARIGVLSYDDDARTGFIQALPGNRFVVVEVSVQNTGTSPISTFLDWRLGDSDGDTWEQAVGVREPSFTGGELAPGETVQGYLTYEVSETATDLTLTVKLDEDTATFALV